MLDDIEELEVDDGCDGDASLVSLMLSPDG